MTASGPEINAVRALSEQLKEAVQQTPIVRCAAIEEAIGCGTSVFGKLEFLQRTGTFKARGALATLHSLSSEQLARGVTAVSAGNHAIATAFAAASLSTSAKVVMIRAANPARIAACRDYGAEVVLADDVHEAFSIAEQIRQSEGRYFVHPFEGPHVALGTGTLGLEICEQRDDFDVIIVPVGGGGLIGGIANVVKRLRPECEVIGVEPRGADTMYRSLRSGKPESVDKVRSIADSLGSPYALPYSFGLAQLHVDRMVLVDDLELRRMMGFLFSRMKIAVEPACAASTAALLGPLRQELKGKRVMLVMCGSNIDWDTFAGQAVFDD
jgi:threonine dehydratase